MYKAAWLVAQFQTRPWLRRCSNSEGMAEIASEYGVDHYKCTVRKREHKRQEVHEDETDAEATTEASLNTASIKHSAKG